MHTMAVIGAGQLGSRHLQALCALPGSTRIYVIDPSTASLDATRQRIAQSGICLDGKQISYDSNFHTLPDLLDYAVVATTSHVRLMALQSLLQQSQVGALILEKVLFDKAASYTEAATLLKQHNVPTWVNCTRREYQPYQSLKQLLAGQKILDFNVTGGAWGLGCNGIHFIDLLAFLCDCDEVASLSTADLDEGHIDSKRQGYIEFTGRLTGKLANGANFSLSSRAASFRHLINIRTEGKSILIDEVGKTMYLFDETDASTFTPVPFVLPYTSEIMARIVGDIISGGGCRLPTYAQSSALHLPFLTSLAQHIGQSADNTVSCMIT